MEEPRKLYRSRTNRILAGVCGGIGEYFNIDPVIIRLLFLLLILQVGSGLLIYIIFALIIPLEPGEQVAIHRGKKIKEFVGDVGHKVQDIAQDIRNNESWFSNRRNFFGSVLILIGLSVLFSQMFPEYWLGWPIIWPVFLVLIGIYVILKK